MPLITNVDADGNVISTTNTYATFDALCLAQTLEALDPSGLISFGADGVPIYPDGTSLSMANTDVIEKTWAGYIQANFDGDLGNTPIRGNLGLRVINTKVNSLGLRTQLTSTECRWYHCILTDDSSFTETKCEKFIHRVPAQLERFG